MKTRHYSVIAIITLTTILLISCSDLKKDLPAPTSVQFQVHGQGWTDTASANFHGNYIQANNWDMRPCQQCHGADYAGGTSEKSCKEANCHPFYTGPENCSTCHGFPPPPATKNDLVGAGAHATHNNGSGTLSSHSMTCTECHVFPSSVYGEGHFTPSNTVGIHLNYPLATMPSGGVTPVPSFDRNTLQCSNTFCHGKWRFVKATGDTTTMFVDSVMTGNSYAPKWNGGANEAICGSCHAMPPTGHKATTAACSTCHEDVRTTSGRQKHINGKVDVYGLSYSFH